MKQQGFREVVIPSIKITTCSGCVFYKREILCTGNDPLWKYNCSHEKIEQVSSMFGNIPDEEQNGYIKTPEWCPFLAEEKKNE